MTRTAKERSKATHRPAPWAERATRIAIRGGILIAALGILEMISWPLRWTLLLRVRNVYNPIPYNTALALAVTGAAIALAARRPSRWVSAAGLFDLALGSATLAETVFNWDLKIDQFFIHAYLVAPGQSPGRMAPNTAACLMVIGGALLILRPHPGRRSAEGLTGAAALVASAALIPSVGYLADIPGVASWSKLIPMALPASLAMCLTAGCMLALAWAVRARNGAHYAEAVAAPAGAAAFIVIVLLWQVLVDAQRTGTISITHASRVVLFLALVASALMGLTAWLAQRAAVGRRKAEKLAVLLGEEAERRATAEAGVRDHEQLLVQLLDALPVGVMIFKAGGVPNLVYLVNQAAARVLGKGFLPDVEVSEIGEKYGTFLAGTDQPYPARQSPSARALAGESSHIDDMEVHRPDGAIIPIEAWGSPVAGDDGQVSFGLTALADISERRRDERALAERADLLDLAMDSIYVSDAQHRITYWNHGAETCFGFTRAEALGQCAHELMRTEFTEPATSIEATVLRDGRWAGELVKHSKTGQRIDVASRWASRFDRDGRVESVLAVETDITARKAAERETASRSAEIEELNLDLARSNDELEQFAYIASHDLSEPLRAISGPVSLLARRYQGQLDPDADRFINFAVDGCQRMQTLINDLLAFSRIGRLEEPPIAVDTNELIRQVLSALTAAVDGAGACVTVDDLPPILGNPTELAQLFQNLIANAIKFRQPDVVPAIHVSATRADGHLRFAVSDNGIGIEARHQERIFGMFKRLHGRDAYPGTGIGLALCKKIVERHKGAIGVEQGPRGVGSTFWFTIPTVSEMSP